MSKRILLSIVTLALGCARTNTVALEYLGTRDGPLGFTCSDGATPLANRILDADHGCLVLDVYLPSTDGSSGDVPSCVSFEFENSPQTRVARYMQPISNDVITQCRAQHGTARAMDCIVHAASGESATEDAPDGPVVMRSLVLGGDCPGAEENIAATRALTDLVGCAYSCPTVLDNVAGNIPLFLPVDPSTCTLEGTGTRGRMSNGVLPLCGDEPPGPRM